MGLLFADCLLKQVQVDANLVSEYLVDQAEVNLVVVGYLDESVDHPREISLEHLHELLGLGHPDCLYKLIIFGVYVALNKYEKLLLEPAELYVEGAFLKYQRLHMKQVPINGESKLLALKHGSIAVVTHESVLVQVALDAILVILVGYYVMVGPKKLVCCPELLLLFNKGDVTCFVLAKARVLIR